MKKILTAVSLFFVMNASGTNYYVSPAGDDIMNNGLSVAAPFKSMQHAADLTAAGDTVFVMNGTYINNDPATNVLDIPVSGTADKPIVYKNYPGHVPLIKLTGNWSAIALQGADYIVIDGFSITGNNDAITLVYAQSQQANLSNPYTSGNGISIDRKYNDDADGPRHVVIRNCIISKCGGGGIYTYGGDYITIENNTVSECGWYAPYGNSGISMYQSRNTDASTGIKNYVTGNTCYRNENYIPFFFAGSITDGNGIIIDDSRNTQNNSTYGIYNGKTYVANNVVFDNGGRGIHVYSSDYVIAVNNTCYLNCKSPAVKDGEFTAIDAGNVSFVNNISLPAADVPPVKQYNATNVTVDYNLWAANALLAEPYGTNSLTGPAAFVQPSVDASLADFHLQAPGAAINTGTRKYNYAPLYDKDGNLRFTTDSVDMGAYEFQTVLPLQLLSFSASRNGKINLLKWGTEQEINTDRFEIQRSSNSKDFVSIGNVKSRNNGNPENDYVFTDAQPLKALNYYRLNMIDKDGRFTYSVTRHTNNTEGFDVTLYSNPVRQNLPLAFNTEKATEVQITIVNAEGKNVYAGKIKLADGTSLQNINVAAFKAGIYFVKFIMADGQAVLKFLKQ
jgi:parallel beta-helix repeat protein